MCICTNDHCDSTFCNTYIHTQTCKHLYCHTQPAKDYAAKIRSTLSRHRCKLTLTTSTILSATIVSTLPRASFGMPLTLLSSTGIDPIDGSAAAFKPCVWMVFSSPAALFCTPRAAAAARSRRVTPRRSDTPVAVDVDWLRDSDLPHDVDWLDGNPCHHNSDAIVLLRAHSLFFGRRFDAIFGISTRGVGRLFLLTDVHRIRHYSQPPICFLLLRHPRTLLDSFNPWGCTTFRKLNYDTEILLTQRVFHRFFRVQLHVEGGVVCVDFIKHKSLSLTELYQDDTANQGLIWAAVWECKVLPHPCGRVIDISTLKIGGTASQIKSGPRDVLTMY